MTKEREIPKMWTVSGEVSKDQNGVPNGTRKQSLPRTISDKSMHDLTDLSGEPTDLRCGYGPCKPSWMQWLNDPKGLLASICFFTLTQSFIINGIVNVNTSTIERRFDLPSAGMGFISSGYDIAATILAIPVSYVGTMWHKPRFMATGALIMSLGSFLFFMPHLLAGNYQGGLPVDDDGLCLPYRNSSDGHQRTSHSGYISVFIIAQLVHGSGGTILYTLAAPLLDENVKVKNSPLYVGIYQSFACLGAALGFMVGGQLLNIYVDTGRVDMDSIGITPEDPRWVGAWWIGPLTSCFMALLVGVALAGFPKRLPGSDRYAEEREKQAYSRGDDPSKPAFGSSLRDLPSAFKVVLTNPTYMCVTLGAVLESGGVSAFALFLSKVIQFQFQQPPAMAAMLGGMLLVPGAAGGQIIGGLIPKFLNLKVRGILRQNMLCGTISVILAFCFLLKCERARIAGVTVPYGNRSISLEDANLYDVCNQNCSCNTERYEPVCGADNIQYFTPCFAGCNDSYEMPGETLAYANCSCISLPHRNVTEAVSGLCESDCSLLPVFLVFFFFIILCTFITNTGGMATTLRGYTSIYRCTPPSHQALAIGVQWVFVRCLGTIPFPIMMGSVFDQVCQVWEYSGGVRGACWIYDSDKLALGLCITALLVKTMSTLLFTVAHFTYRATHDVEEGTTTTIGVQKESRKGSDITVEGVSFRATGENIRL